jgi:FlgN protein
VTSVAHIADERLAHDVLAHLDAQIASTERLLEAVLRQGVAVRGRDVETVLTLLAGIQAEMDGRGRLEIERGALLSRAAAALGVTPADVTLERMAVLMPPAAADLARARSAHLRGLLARVEREHATNRALMRQELAFLDHLVRLIGEEPEAGYRPPRPGRGPAAQPAPAHLRALDLRA